jgi:hypothetical protein
MKWDFAAKYLFLKTLDKSKKMCVLCKKYLRCGR